MIVWRGWGIVALLVGGASVGLGAAIGSATGFRSIVTGLCTLAGAVGVWFLGTYLNQSRAVAGYDQWYAARRDEIAALVRGGHYSQVPDPQRPGQFADPWAVGEYVLRTEAERVRRSATNTHTLFFIPMQYWAFVFAALGILFLVTNAFAR